MNRILFFLNCGCIFLLASFAYAQEQVKPATLKDSVVLAVKNHPKIKAMMHNRDAMRGNKAAALGRFFPSLDLRSSSELCSIYPKTVHIRDISHRGAAMLNW